VIREFEIYICIMTTKENQIRHLRAYHGDWKSQKNSERILKSRLLPSERMDEWVRKVTTPLLHARRLRKG
jgi:hypothetical protein